MEPNTDLTNIDAEDKPAVENVDAPPNSVKPVEGSEPVPNDFAPALGVESEPHPAPLSPAPSAPEKEKAEHAEGDVVQLKSGGPKMTVSSIENGVAVCVWHSEQGAIESHPFKLSMLD